MAKRLIQALAVVVLTGAVISPLPAQELAAAPSADRWQIRRLMQPTPAELEREAKGEVFIYENLKDTEVRTALEANFDRIEHMMFIGTLKTDGAGEVRRDPDTNAAVVEDNGGC